MRKTCDTCAAFGKLAVIGRPPVWANEYGSCRRRAAVDSEFMWPVVHPKEWCLEWEEEDIF